METRLEQGYHKPPLFIVSGLKDLYEKIWQSVKKKKKSKMSSGVLAILEKISIPWENKVVIIILSLLIAQNLILVRDFAYYSKFRLL